MNDEILKLSKAIRESISPLLNLQKNAEVDAKLILSETIEKLIESQSLISVIQSSYQEILNAKEQMAKKILQYEQWKEDTSKYESFRLKSGCTVMVSKESNQEAYEKEWYCKNCFDNNKKSQLQPVLRTIEYSCSTCKNKIWVTDEEYEMIQRIYGNPAPPPKPPRRPTDWNVRI